VVRPGHASGASLFMVVMSDGLLAAYDDATGNVVKEGERVKVADIFCEGAEILTEEHRSGGVTGRVGPGAGGVVLLGRVTPLEENARAAEGGNAGVFGVGQKECPLKILGKNGILKGPTDEKVLGASLAELALEDGKWEGVIGLVTDLGLMAEHAVLPFYSYNILAGLSLQHGRSSWSSIYLVTSNHSVVILSSASRTLTDVHCCHRLAHQITRIFFCPNGRFLACFTSGSILTVLSTSFETKVLDFDTSKGSSSPPKEMAWYWEDTILLHWRNLGMLVVGPYGE